MPRPASPPFPVADDPMIPALTPLRTWEYGMSPHAAGRGQPGGPRILEGADSAAGLTGAVGGGELTARRPRPEAGRVGPAIPRLQMAAWWAVPGGIGRATAWGRAHAIRFRPAVHCSIHTASSVDAGRSRRVRVTTVRCPTVAGCPAAAHRPAQARCSAGARRPAGARLPAKTRCSAGAGVSAGRRRTTAATGTAGQPSAATLARATR